MEGRLEEIPYISEISNIWEIKIERTTDLGGDHKIPQTGRHTPQTW